MRILHTSDWHLGHTLHGLSRDFEHGRFLDWLIATLQRERIDVLLICGDVFDTANPSARAQQAYYRFLARANRTVPHLQVVVIAGNHDSALRLQAPREILHAMQVHVVGEARDADGDLWLDRMVVPMRDREGNLRAWCAAVPFLRPSDLDLVAADEDPLVEGVRRVYAEVLCAAGARRGPGQALVALGHCFMVGTEISELSERKILGGNQHALPANLFAAGGGPSPSTDAGRADYVALGHLHKAQRVGGTETMRYSGSPIPLSMAEGRNRQQVVLVEFPSDAVGTVTADDAYAPTVRTLPIPRAVDFFRIPATGAATLETIRSEIEALSPLQDLDDTPRPFLEVCILVDRPLPEVRHEIEALLGDRAPRLVKLTLQHPTAPRALGELDAVAEQTTLQDLSAEQVFRALYESRHGGEAPPDLLAAFHELVDQVGQQGASGGSARDDAASGLKPGGEAEDSAVESSGASEESEETEASEAREARAETETVSREVDAKRPASGNGARP